MLAADITDSLPPDGGGFAAASVVPRRAWTALAVLMIGMFMALLDTTIVNVALTTIRTSLNASEATLSWIISGYALAFGLALIPAGRVGDRIGHKWVFFTGLALFTIASFFCGLAQNDVQLVVSRVIQGLAGGIFVPAVTAMIQLMFPYRVRGRAFGIMGAVIGVSTAIGPIIGGLIIEAFGDENGWRLVFWVNLPIGVIALVAAAILLPAGSEQLMKTGIDWFGLVLLSAGLIAVLVPLIEGESQGWPPWTYATLVAGALLIVAFAFWEVRMAKSSGSPLVPPHLFAHPAFTGGVVLALVYFAAFTGIFFTLSILWHAGLGHTALEAGLVSVPFAIGSAIGIAVIGSVLFGTRDDHGPQCGGRGRRIHVERSGSTGGERRTQRGGVPPRLRSSEEGGSGPNTERGASGSRIGLRPGDFPRRTRGADLSR